MLVYSYYTMAYYMYDFGTVILYEIMLIFY